MTEKIEPLRAKLQDNPLAQLRIFMYGEINVIKARTDYHVATQVSKTIDGNERRRIKPAIDTSNNLDRASDIRSQSVCHAIHRSIGGDDIYRIARLHLNDRT